MGPFLLQENATLSYARSMFKMNPFARTTSIIFLFIISFSFCASANDGTSARELYDQSKYSEALELLKKKWLKKQCRLQQCGAVCRTP